MRHPIDLTGKTIDCWEVLGLEELQYNQSMWKCRCTKCGAIEIISRKRLLHKSKKRCDACQSHISVEAYTEYLKSRRYSKIDDYLRVINNTLDLYPMDQVMEAYESNNLDTLVEIIKPDASLSFKKLRRRQIRVYCDYIQMEGAVQA